jgi:hydrogenase 3 maturation protease
MKTLVMCIGNRDNGDDGIGPYLAERFPKGFNVVDCGVIPENFTHLSRDMDRIILIDAVDMGLLPGEIRIIPKERIPLGSLSTHNMPLSVLMEYLEKEGKEVVLIGIQPKKFEGGLSKEVKIAGERVIHIITEDRVGELEVLR